MINYLFSSRYWSISETRQKEPSMTRTKHMIQNIFNTAFYLKDHRGNRDYSRLADSFLQFFESELSVLSVLSQKAFRMLRRFGSPLGKNLNKMIRYCYLSFQNTTRRQRQLHKTKKSEKLEAMGASFFSWWFPSCSRNILPKFGGFAQNK